MQRRWRVVGGIALAAAAAMAWYGVKARFLVGTPLLCAAYWGGFVFLLGAALYVVVLDLRYIRLLYALEERELFRQTVGDEEFRSALLARHKEKPADKSISHP